MKNFLIKFKNGVVGDVVLMAIDEADAVKRAVAEARLVCDSCSALKPRDIVESVSETDAPVTSGVRAYVTDENYVSPAWKETFQKIVKG